MKKLIIVLLLFGPIKTWGQEALQKLVYYDFPIVNFNAVAPADSCYFVASTFKDTISGLSTGIMFTKLNPHGEIVFASSIKEAGKLFSNVYSDLIFTNDGNLANVGIMIDSAVIGRVIKYSPQGDTLFTKEFLSILSPDLIYMVPIEIRQKSNGDFLVLVAHESVLFEDFDISLLTLDSLFNIIDYQTYGTTTKQEIAMSLTLTPDGGILIGADRDNLNQVSSNFTYQSLIIKLNNDGEPEWEYLSSPGELRNSASAMVNTTDGGLVVASGIGIEEMPSPSFSQVAWDALIFKLDSNQNEVWSTPFRGAVPWNMSELVEMVAAEDGSGYVALGRVADGTFVPGPWPSTWIVKVSPEGDSLWARYYSHWDGEYINPIPKDLKQTPDGGYVAVGRTQQLGEPAPGWILKVDAHGCLIPGCHLTDATGEVDQPEIQLAIYPNPTSDYLNFQLRGGQAGSRAAFRITDAQGRIVRELESAATGATLIVPVWEWAAGVYFLQYMEEGEVLVSEKFVVVK